MSNKYAKDSGTDSRQPFINNSLHGGGPSSMDNGSVNRNNFTTSTSNGGLNNSSSGTSEKKTKAQFEMAQLERTISRLKTWLLAMFAVCVAGFVILIVVVSVLYVTLNSELVHHTHKPKVGEIMGNILNKEELCVPCREFKLGPSQEEEDLLKLFTMRQDEHGEHDCCVDTPIELLQLMKMFVERRFRQEMSKGTINFRRNLGVATQSDNRPAAHLLLPSAPKTGAGNLKIPGKLHMIEDWIDHVDMAFLRDSVEYRQGRLKVPESGVYFVYSQISFWVPHDAGRQQNTVLHHYLFRMNMLYSGETMLSKSTMTASQCGDDGQSSQGERYSEYVSHLAAAFTLRAQDEIFIKVSNISMVTYGSKMGHFGLFQVMRGEVDADS